MKSPPLPLEEAQARLLAEALGEDALGVRFVLLDELPRTHLGKVDRGKLKGSKG